MDGSDPLYNESRVEGLKSHQRKLVDGSDPFYLEITFALEILNCTYFGLIGEELKRRSEQSTNFRWWDLASSQRFIQSGEDLKHPPTAVGGIGLFVQSHSTAKTQDPRPKSVLLSNGRCQIPNIAERIVYPRIAIAVGLIGRWQH